MTIIQMAQTVSTASDGLSQPTIFISSEQTAPPPGIVRMDSCSFTPAAFICSATSALLAFMKDCGAWAYSQ